MTGIPPLPSVQLGNTATDIGSGANTFVQGLIGQRVRQQQIAMQQAMAQSRAGLEQAQTADVTAQAAGRTQEALPADDTDESLFSHYAGTMPPGFFRGKTKGQAQELTKAAMMAHAVGLRMGMTGGNQVYNHFANSPDIKKGGDALDAMNNIRGLLSANTSIGYKELFGSLARMALPNNARAVGQMLNQLSSSGIMKGPFNPQENALVTLNRLAASDGQLPLPPEIKNALWRTAIAMLGPHMEAHDRMKMTAMAQVREMNLPFDESYFESSDPFKDYRGTAQPMGPAGPTAPTGQPQPNPNAKPYDHYLTQP